MKRFPWTAALMLLLFCLGAFGALLMARQFLAYQKAEEARDRAVTVAAVPPSPVTYGEAEPLPAGEAADTSGEEEKPRPAPVAEALLAYDLDALRAVNPDVLGWICIPDTGISYPLLQTGDNSTYLSHSWEGKESAAGSIFLDYRSDAGLGDFNTIVYGHHMKNGSMFAELLGYREQSYYDAHPAVWIVTAEGAYCYRVFSAYEAGVETAAYATGFADEEAARAALDFYCRSSGIVTGLEPTVSDRLLTLSTCVGNGRYDVRWVVQAVLAAAYPRA